MNKNKHKYRIFYLLILFMVIGFAYLSTTLNITGTININDSKYKIYWDNQSVVVNPSSTSASVPSVTESDTKVSFTTNLELPGDFYEFTVDAVNDGTIDAMVYSIETTVTSNGEETTLPDYIRFSVTYDDGTAITKYNKLAKRVDVNNPTKEKYRVRLEYLKSSTTLPEEDLTYTIDYRVTYQQANENAKQRPVCTSITSSESIYNFDSLNNTITGFKSDLAEEPSSIDIPCRIDGVDVLTIGEGAFINKSITTVNLNNNLQEIKTGAFSGTQIRKITIPDSVKKLDGSSLNIPTLEELTIGNGITTFPIGILPNSSQSIRKVVFGEGIKEIKSGLFYGYSNLEDVTLGENVERIQASSFKNTKIERIELPKSLKSIGPTAFENTKLKELKTNEGLEEISFSAFENCSDLKKVTFSSTVKNILAASFKKCAIEDLVIPSNVEIIGASAFYENNLKTVTILATNTAIAEYSLLSTSDKNPNLSKIINKTGKSYNWNFIVNGNTSSEYTFEFGNITTTDGRTIKVTNS